MAKSKKNKLPIKLANPIIKELDFSNQKMVSFSQYQIYQSCNFKWYNQYIRKIKPEPNINMTFGTAMHNVLQHYLTVMYNESGAAADRLEINQLFENSLKEEYLKEYTKLGKHFSTKEEMNEFFEDGIAIIKWFKSHRAGYFSTKEEFLVGCELPIQKH